MIDNKQTILNASEIIAMYNKPLATKFVNEPFNRINIARAFAAGFVNSAEDDAPTFCYTILEAALLDKEIRKEGSK